MWRRFSVLFIVTITAIVSGCDGSRPIRQESQDSSQIDTMKLPINESGENPEGFGVFGVDPAQVAPDTDPVEVIMSFGFSHVAEFWGNDIYVTKMPSLEEAHDETWEQVEAVVMRHHGETDNRLTLEKTSGAMRESEDAHSPLFTLEGITRFIVLPQEPDFRTLEHARIFSVGHSADGYELWERLETFAPAAN